MTFADVKSNASMFWFDVKWKTKKKFEETKKWCEDHTELAIAMIPVGLMIAKGVGNTIRSVDRKIDLKKEQELQDLYIYDHSLGMYHKLRRPLKPSEKIEINRRIQNGETKIQILANMGLLD